MWRLCVCLILHWILEFPPQPCQTIKKWSLNTGSISRLFTQPKVPPPIHYYENSLSFSSTPHHEMNVFPSGSLEQFALWLHWFYSIWCYFWFPIQHIFAQLDPQDLEIIGDLVTCIAQPPRCPLPSPGTWYTFSVHRGIKLLNPVDFILMG